MKKMSIQQQQTFLNRLYEFIPQAYIQQITWLDTSEWIKEMKANFGLVIDVNLNRERGIYIWENKATYGFITYKDLCNLSVTQKAEIKQAIGQDVLCYLFFDFEQKGIFSTTLCIDFVPDFLFTVGIHDLKIAEQMNGAGIHFSFDKMPFLAFSPTTQHCIWVESSDEPMFSTFPILSLEQNAAATHIKQEFELIAYSQELFSSFFDVKTYNPTEEDYYFYHDNRIFKFLNHLTENIKDACLYDKKHEHLRQWTASISKRKSSTKETRLKEEYEYFVLKILDQLDTLKNHPQFKDIIIHDDYNRQVTIYTYINNQRRGWHYAYMDGLGGPDFEDYFMVFSDACDY